MSLMENRRRDPSTTIPLKPGNFCFVIYAAKDALNRV